MPTPEDAHRSIVAVSVKACEKINEFASKVLHTRGGRIGSGMGTLLEALWGYYINEFLSLAEAEAAQIEIAWMPGHSLTTAVCRLLCKKATF